MQVLHKSPVNSPASKSVQPFDRPTVTSLASKSMRLISPVLTVNFSTGGQTFDHQSCFGRYAIFRQCLHTRWQQPQTAVPVNPGFLSSESWSDRIHRCLSQDDSEPRLCRISWWSTSSQNDLNLEENFPATPIDTWGKTNSQLIHSNNQADENYEALYDGLLS